MIVFSTLSEPIVLCSLNMIALKYSKSLSDDVDFIYFISNLAHLFLFDPYISVHLDACNTLSQKSFIGMLLCQFLESPLIEAEVNHYSQTKQCKLLISLFVNMKGCLLLDSLELEFKGSRTPRPQKLLLS